MHTVHLSKENMHDYQSFITRMDGTLFYHQIMYKNMLENILACDSNYRLLYDGDELCGILPLLYKDGQYGKVINSLPFFGSNGGVIAKNDTCKTFLFNEYISISNDCISSVYIENPFVVNNINPLNHTPEKRICQITNLDDIKEINDLETCFDPSKRWDIKKAIKYNVKVSKSNSEDTKNFLYETHKNHMSFLGLNWKSKDAFNFLYTNFTPELDYNIFIGKIESRMISALLVLYYKNITEYYCPVVLPDYRNSQALSLTIYEAMKYSYKTNRNIWNWGASGKDTNSSVYKFKEKWNSIDKNYNYHILINDENILLKTINDLNKNYEGFFVAPYSKLINKD